MRTWAMEILLWGCLLVLALGCLELSAIRTDLRRIADVIAEESEDEDDSLAASAPAGVWTPPSPLKEARR